MATCWIPILVFIIFQIAFSPVLTLNRNNNEEPGRNSPSNNKGLRLDDHTRLTEDKKLTLEIFRNRVMPKLKKDHMKHDLYLLRFLEAKNFDLEKAELMLLNNLEFREENNMDGIQEEDWSDMEKEYPYRVDGVDKLGRPIVQFDFGKWNVNKATDEGKQKRLLRYYDKMLDEATMKVIDLQNQGKNVTQWVWLCDMGDVNLAQHVGFKSGRFYYDATNSLEHNHPGMSSHILLLNNPGVFDTVMGVIRSIMTDETNDHFKGYRNPKEWKPVLDNFIDPDQLPPAYGGTKGTKPIVHGGYIRKEDGSWWFWKGY